MPIFWDEKKMQKILRILSNHFSKTENDKNRKIHFSFGSKHCPTFSTKKRKRLFLRREDGTGDGEVGMSLTRTGPTYIYILYSSQPGVNCFRLNYLQQQPPRPTLKTRLYNYAWGMMCVCVWGMMCMYVYVLLTYMYVHVFNIITYICL